LDFNSQMIVSLSSAAEAKNWPFGENFTQFTGNLWWVIFATNFTNLFYFSLSLVVTKSFELSLGDISHYWNYFFTLMKAWDSESVPPVTKTILFWNWGRDWEKGKKSIDMMRSLLPCQYISGISIRICLIFYFIVKVKGVPPFIHTCLNNLAYHLIKNLFENLFDYIFI
jgi:hypothetical protein